ncbi:hypothetical protein SBA5_240066 [Candidatus Sulfotelmatomonas gaucii]|uniref:Uncharacterized protein n=1 Tax=Candidatus Sulfuritelmatomonas gaucii TaxID=2043161 RepID=A0A2N9L8M3_9BACT|nr:hypothetical protein SBA5_240066 [Candidatus Sulfotelmatomonas gaucii]
MERKKTHGALFADDQDAVSGLEVAVTKGLEMNELTDEPTSSRVAANLAPMFFVKL